MSRRPVTEGGPVLVVTTVHPPDDPRVRQRTVGVLAATMPVRYASRSPGPTDQQGFTWVPLPGARLARAVRALREALRPDVAVVSVHDPELIPIALLARAAGRRAVVDVHEDVPAQILDKEWLPGLLRRPLAAVAVALLRIAERVCTITLAEQNYAHLFRDAHPVFVNYPVTEHLPDPRPDSDGTIVYVGDVTRARGAELAVRAVAAMGSAVPLTLIGRCREPLRTELTRLAAALGVELHLCGFLPHAEAMQHAASAAVGLSPLLGLPNHRDSLPSKVIEYLAIGIPVVASDLPGTRRVVEDVRGVMLVEAGDVQAWAQALEEIIADPHCRVAAQQGAHDVRRRHAWASDDLRALYEQLRSER